MKAILLTLRNFFAQTGWTIVNATIGTLWLIMGIIHITSEDPDMYYRVLGEFFFALIMFLPMIFNFLILQLRTDFSELIPGYRRVQLYSVVPIIIIYFLVPVIFLAAYGYPAVQFASVSLFTLALLSLFIVKMNPDNIYVLIIIAWPVIFLYESFGLASDLIVFGPADFDSFIFSSELSALLVIIFSVGALAYFVRYYLRVPSVKMTKEKWLSENQYAKDLDVPSRFAEKRLANLLNGTEEKSGRYSRSRLIQTAIFSPRTTLLLRQIFIAAAVVLMFYTISLVAEFGRDGRFRLDGYYFLTAAYYFMASTIATDFLQHRSNLSSIWLTGLPGSRKEFAALIFANYLAVMLLSYTVVTCSLIAIFAILLGLGWIPGMIPWVIIGLLVTIFIFSISLIFNGTIRSDDARGWTIANIITGIGLFLTLILTEADLTTPADMIIAFTILTAFDLFLLWGAWASWRKTDFAFSMPFI
jgi:hypothetical protein